MRVRNCCLALALSSVAGPSLVSAAKQAKTNANTNANTAPPPASFVLADKVAALSPSEKHRLEQLLLISGRYDLALNVNIEDAIEAVEGSDIDNTAGNNHGRRRRIKAEQSDADLYIGNNADGNDNDNDGDAVNPEDVTGDPRELPLPGGNSGNGSSNLRTIQGRL